MNANEYKLVTSTLTILVSESQNQSGGGSKKRLKLTPEHTELLKVQQFIS